MKSVTSLAGKMEILNQLRAPPPAPSQGPNVASLGTGLGWTTPGNVTACDGATASFVLAGGAGTSGLTASGFGFTVPDTATVTGLKVTLRRRAGGDIGDPTTLTLVKPPFLPTTTKSDPTLWPLVLADAEYGGAADLWGSALTPGVVNAPSFGVRVMTNNSAVGGSDTAEIDCVEMTVYYTP